MKKLLLSLLLSFGFFLLTAHYHAVHAQVLKFELATPQNQISVNGTVQVRILINTAGQQAINGDALITFDPSKINFDSTVFDGGFFTYHNDPALLGGSANKYLVSSWEESVAHAKSTTTDKLFATLHLTLKASPATITFDCINGTGSDSNINRASDSRDIIVCPLIPLTITAGSGTGVSSTPAPSPTGGGIPSPTTSGGGGITATDTPVPTETPIPTETPTPTVTPVPTNTPIPTNTIVPSVSQLPRSGTTEVTVWGIGIGAFLFIAGVFLVAV